MRKKIMSTKKYPLSFFIYENHENLACIGGTGGIRGNNGNNCHGKQPQNGSDASTSEGFRNVFGSPIIKAGGNADIAGIIDKDNGYNNQPYLSVNYTNKPFFIQITQCTINFGVYQVFAGAIFTRVDLCDKIIYR